MGGFFVVLLERAVSELVWRSKVVVHVDATESGIILREGYVVWACAKH